jgi:lipopolysaccharide/colanic/teichoic acid biosynthesis glycosyltransferase
MLAFYLVRSHRAIAYGTALAAFFALAFVYQSLRYRIRFAKLARQRETVLIVGTGREAQKIWKHLRIHCDQLVTFKGFVAASASQDAAPDILARTACTIDSLERFLQETPVDTFVLTSTGPDERGFAEAAKEIARSCGSRILCANGTEQHLHFAHWFHDACDDYVELGRPDAPTRLSLALKALADRVLAGAALLLAIPVALPLLLLYRLILGESALVSQTAYGYHRRPFKMWDLRIATGRQRALYDASKLRVRRVATVQAQLLARVGYFLQISGLARAPRLWNVLVGEMSLVGPRPVLPAQIAVGNPAALLRRYSMRPGVCWPKGETLRTEDQATLAYLEHWSPALDWMTFAQWFRSRARRTLYAISASLVPEHTPLAEPTQRT